EKIQVLRLPIDARVLVDGVGAADDVGDARLVQRIERAFVLLPLLLGNPEIAVGDGSLLLAREPAGSGYARCLRVACRHFALVEGRSGAESSKTRAGREGAFCRKDTEERQEVA